MLTTTGALLIGGAAVLLGALIHASGSAALQAPDVLLFLGTTAALALARRPGRD